MTLSKELDKVQKAIISVHREAFGESPSPMKLQKLCYYAQGYSLAEGHQLFPEDFQAWQHGPVIPELYRKYQSLKWRPIDLEIEQNDVDQNICENISDIVQAYGCYDGAALSTMTHREAPWINARQGLPESEGSAALISKDSLKTYFTSKLCSYDECETEQN